MRLVQILVLIPVIILDFVTAASVTNTVQAITPDPFQTHIANANELMGNGKYLEAATEMETALSEQSTTWIRDDYYRILAKAYPEVWLDSHPTNQGALLDIFMMMVNSNKFDEATELLAMYPMAAGKDYEKLQECINYKMKVVGSETHSTIRISSNTLARIRAIENSTNRTFMGVIYGSTTSAQAAGHVYRGELLLKSKKYVASANEFREAKRLKPSWRHVAALLTECEMENDLEAWLVKHPGHSYAWLRLFMGAIDRGQYAKATNLLERAPPHLKHDDVYGKYLDRESARGN